MRREPAALIGLTRVSRRIISKRSRARHDQCGLAILPTEKKRSLRIRSVSGSISSSRTWTRFTKPITSRLPPICKVPHSAHSKLAGDSAMRGGRTTDDVRIDNPTLSSSLVPYPTVAAVRFIGSATSSSTRLTTNSCVSRMLRAVSFGVPSFGPQGKHPQWAAEIRAR